MIFDWNIGSEIDLYISYLAPLRETNLRTTEIRETSGMTPAEIREEVLDILSDIAPDEDLSQLDDEKRFREQLELDSMDFLDIVMELRKR